MHDGEKKESKTNDILNETEQENGTKNLKNSLMLELDAYACQSCGKKFTKITQLSKHIKSVHSKLATLLICKRVGLLFLFLLRSLDDIC